MARVYIQRYLQNESTGEVASVEMTFPFPGNDEQYAANGHAYLKLSGAASGVGVPEVPSEETSESNWLHVSPNPASGSLSVSFNLQEQSSILISLTDNRGHAVSLLQKDNLNPGIQSFNLDVSHFALGLYLLTLKSADNGRLIGSEKVILR